MLSGECPGVFIALNFILPIVIVSPSSKGQKSYSGLSRLLTYISAPVFLLISTCELTKSACGCVSIIAFIVALFFSANWKYGCGSRAGSIRAISLSLSMAYDA